MLFAAVHANGAELLSGAALVEALRGGGHSIYFRHAQTEWSQNDRIINAGDWTSCDPARVRQLSEEGRRTAREVGEAMRSIRIPVGAVLSSEYCRTVATARLLDVGTVQPTRDIMNMRSAEFVGGREAVIRRARKKLAEVPEAGTNTVIVAHGNLAKAATGAYPGEAGAAIFRPDGKGGFSLVATVTPAQWLALAESHGMRP